MKTGAVKEGNLTGPEFAMDFPAINNSIMGMKNKYGYTQVLDTISSSNLGKYIFHVNIHSLVNSTNLLALNSCQ